MIEKAIIRRIKKKRYVVHGGKNLNAQLPKELYRPTEDYDLYGRNPQLEAFKMQEYLDRTICGGNDCFTDTKTPLTGSKGEYVFRVVDRKTGRVVVDFMRSPNHLKYIIISKIRYEVLRDEKRRLMETLSDPAKSHRWSKSQIDLDRIEAFEKSLDLGIVTPKQLKWLPSLKLLQQSQPLF